MSRQAARARRVTRTHEASAAEEAARLTPAAWSELQPGTSSAEFQQPARSLRGRIWLRGGTDTRL